MHLYVFRARESLQWSTRSTCLSLRTCKCSWSALSRPPRLGIDLASSVLFLSLCSAPAILASWYVEIMHILRPLVSSVCQNFLMVFWRETQKLGIDYYSPGVYILLRSISSPIVLEVPKLSSLGQYFFKSWLS